MQKKETDEPVTEKLLFFSLPLGKSEEELKLQVENALNGYGVKGFEMEKGDQGAHKGEALVQFNDANCAKRAHAFIAGKNIKGTVYQACFEGQLPAEVIARQLLQTQPTNHIEINNCVPDITAIDIKERFKRYGLIKDARVSQSPSGQSAVAYVSYEGLEGAEKALNSMNNVEYCNRTIKVVFYDPNAPVPVPKQSNPTPSTSRDPPSREPQSRDSSRDSRPSDSSRDGRDSREPRSRDGRDSGRSGRGSERDRDRERDSRPADNTPAANIKSPSPPGIESKPAPKPASNGSDKILIKDLANDVTEESLRHDLRDYSNIANVMLMATAKPAPFAYVRFVDPADAKKAQETLNGYRPRINTEKGWVVTLQTAGGGNAASKKPAATPPTGLSQPRASGKSAVVRGLAVRGMERMRIADLAGAFEKYGTVTNVKFMDETNAEAIVEFQRIGAAENAVRHLDGTKLKNRTMNVQLGDRVIKQPVKMPPGVASGPPPGVNVSKPPGVNTGGGGGGRMTPMVADTTSAPVRAPSRVKEEKPSAPAPARSQPRKDKGKDERPPGVSSSKRKVKEEKPAAAKPTKTKPKAKKSAPAPAALASESEEEEDVVLSDETDDDDEAVVAPAVRPTSSLPDRNRFTSLLTHSVYACACPQTKRVKSNGGDDTSEDDKSVVKRRVAESSVGTPATVEPVKPAPAKKEKKEEKKKEKLVLKKPKVYRQWYKSYMIKVSVACFERLSPTRLCLSF